jgi:uncharacterized protein (TIGR03437 family)
VKVGLQGANPAASVHALDPQPGRSNYYLGTEPSDWKTGVPQFGAVRYAEIYPGIDWVFHGNTGELEFDFNVSPGSDPGQIRLRYTGTGSMELDKDGSLLLHVAGASIRQKPPVAYQEQAGSRRIVAARYRMVEPGLVAFDLGAFDPRKRLVIDPILSYGALIGGPGEDRLEGLAADNQGAVLLSGSTDSAQLPNATNRPGGLDDCYVTKFDFNSRKVIYTTFLGGRGVEVCPGVAVALDGAVYVAGSTTSPDLPTTAGAFQPTYLGGLTGFDAFVARLDAGGTLRFLTYLGGSGDEFMNAAAADSSGVYVAGFTLSSDFRGLGEGRPANLPDAFLVKLSPTGAYQFGTYYGGEGLETPVAVGLLSGDAILAGWSNSSNDNGGNVDGFLARFDSKGTQRAATTLGGSGTDVIEALAINEASNTIAVTGWTNSRDFPTFYLSPPVQPTFGGGDTDAFVSIFRSDFLMVGSTYLGGRGRDAGESIIYLSGLPGPPIQNMAVLVAGKTSSFDFLPAGNPNPLAASSFLISFAPFLERNTVNPSPARFVTYFAPQTRIALARQTVNGANAVYAAGTAASAFRFPSSTSPPANQYAGGISDIFVAKLSTTNLRVRITNLDPPLNLFGNDAKTPAAGIQPRAIDIVPGSNAEVTVEVSNDGPEDATEVISTLELPPGAVPVRCTAAGASSFTLGPNRVTVRYATLLARDTRRYSVVLRMGPDAGPVNVTATVTADVVDVIQQDNLSTGGINVIGVAPFTTNIVPPIRLGTVASGSAGVAGFSVQPNGTIDLRFTLTTSSGGTAEGFSLTGGSPTATASERVDRTIEFRPTRPGAFAAQLDISVPSRDFFQTYNIEGSATGLTITEVTDIAGRSRISGNSYFVIRGADLYRGSPDTWDRFFVGDRAPDSLNGVSVTVAGRRGYVSFVSPGQVNVLAPVTLPAGDVTVMLSAPHGSTSYTAGTEPFQPAFFLQDREQVAARHATDFVRVGPRNLYPPPENPRPAIPGEIIQVYLTSLGPTVAVPLDGRNPTVSPTTNTCVVTIAGSPVSQSFCGLTSLMGLYAVNVSIPNLANGEYPISITVAGRPTPPGRLTIER